MNKQQAKQEGLQFTGFAEWDKDKPKEEALRIRRLGFRALVITIGTMYGVVNKGTVYGTYAEQAYFDYEEIQSMKKCIEQYDVEERQAYADYMAKLEEIRNNRARDKEMLDQKHLKYDLSREYKSE